MLYWFSVCCRLDFYCFAEELAHFSLENIGYKIIYTCLLGHRNLKKQKVALI